MESDIQEVVLRKIEFGFRQLLADSFVESNIDMAVNHAMRAIEIHVGGYLWGEEPQHYSFQYPSDWWQAVKDRWFPAWAKRIYPVKYTHHNITVNAVYPDLKISLPDHKLKILISGYQSTTQEKAGEDEE